MSIENPTFLDTTVKNQAVLVFMSQVWIYFRRFCFPTNLSSAQHLCFPTCAFWRYKVQTKTGTVEQWNQSTSSYQHPSWQPHRGSNHLYFPSGSVCCLIIRCFPRRSSAFTFSLWSPQDGNRHATTYFWILYRNIVKKYRILRTLFIASYWLKLKKSIPLSIKNPQFDVFTINPLTSEFSVDILLSAETLQAFTQLS